MVVYQRLLRERGNGALPIGTELDIAAARNPRGCSVPEPFHTPIVITSSKSGARATIAATKGGFNVHITGGITAAELEAALRRLLKA